MFAAATMSAVVANQAPIPAQKFFASCKSPAVPEDGHLLGTAAVTLLCFSDLCS